MGNIIFLTILVLFTHQSLQCSNQDFHIEINDICYWLIQTKQNQSDSYNLCIETGGHLALIPGEKELNAVVDLTQRDSNKYYMDEIFIGYYIDDDTDTLVSLSGEPASFQKFYSQDALKSSWVCVSLFVGHYYQEKCDLEHYALCSNITNEVPTVKASSQIEPSTSSVDEYTSASTTAIAHAQLSTSVVTSCVCDTTCTQKPAATQTLYINMTKELNSKLQEITNAIKVEKSTLTSTVSKKISADDSRPSAKGIGSIGVAILVLVFVGIIALDAPLLLAELKCAFRRFRTGIRITRNNRLNNRCGCCSPD